MKRPWRWFFALFLLGIGSQAFGLDRSAVAGKYELQGVMEMAGGLMLKPDGNYLAGFSYGAADWVEEGAWKLEDGEVVLSGGRFKQKNYDKLPLFLPAGTRLKYRDGKLNSTDPERKLVFIDPSKTPSGKDGQAGEGRMRVQGKLVRLDAETLVVNTGERLSFDVGSLSASLRKAVAVKVGQKVDVEIPYSAMLGSGTCN